MLVKTVQPFLNLLLSQTFEEPTVKSLNISDHHCPWPSSSQLHICFQRPLSDSLCLPHFMETLFLDRKYTGPFTLTGKSCFSSHRPL